MTSGVADYHKQQPTRHVTLACYCGPVPIDATYSLPVVFHTITSSLTFLNVTALTILF